MNLICDGTALADATAKVSKALGQKAVNPMFDCFKIEAEKGSLTITATDSEITIQTTIIADVMEEGSTLVPGRLFADFIKKLTNEQILLKLSGNRLTIKYATSEGSFACADVDAYPQLKDMSQANHFVMKGGEFKFIVSKVAFSVGNDSSRPMLKGVSMSIKDGNVSAIALDGYRLGKCSRPIVSNTTEMSAIAPARTMNEISKLIGDDEENIKIYVLDGNLKADLGNTTLISVLLDGEYNEYSNLFADTYNTIMAVGNSAYSDCLERSLLLTKNDKSNPIKLDITEQSMQMTSVGESGNLSENLPIVLTGHDISIAFNAKYFHEILRAIDDDTVFVKMNTPSQPCIVEPANNESNYLYLLLPVKMI